jgi:hypothetical protein
MTTQLFNTVCALLFAACLLLPLLSRNRRVATACRRARLATRRIRGLYWLSRGLGR